MITFPRKYLFTHNNEDNSDIPVAQDLLMTDTTATYPRGNKDTIVNQYGEQLIALCRSVPLRVCNGHKVGDIVGEYTCYKWNGQSVEHYCLASPGVYNKISSYQVHDFIPQLSDHCPISLKLETEVHEISLSNYAKSQELLQNPKKLNWSLKIKDNFEAIIQSNEAKLFLSNFAQNGIKPEKESIDSATDFFTDFLVNSAIQADKDKLKIECKASK